MDGLLYDDLKKVAKVIFFCLVGFAIFNHIIKLSVHYQGSQTINTLKEWSLVSAMKGGLVAVDRFRFAVGQNFSTLAEICPVSLKPNCRDILYGLRLILGLH